MNRSSFILVAGAVLLCAGVCLAQDYERIDGKWVKIVPPKPGTPAGDLQLLRQAVQEHADGAAVGAAKAFIKKHPGEIAQEEVMMLAAQAEMHRGRYWQAFDDWIEKQLSQFPAGKYSQRVLQWEYDIGDAFLNGKKRVVWGIFNLSAQPEGLEILHKVVEHAPGSDVGERAMMRIAEYHFNHRDWPEAIVDYDEFVKLFRNSPKVPYATLQAAKASFLSYRGAAFDDTPLLDAEQRFKIYREHYPDQAAKAQVDQTLANIRDLRAMKLLTTAEFYQRIGHPVAQALNYRQVNDQFPRTPSAELAQARLAKLGDLTPASGPAPQPQTRPFTPPPPEPVATQPTTGTTTGPTSTSKPTTGPVRIEDLVPTTGSATKPAPTTQPAGK
jgi:outer membrane assembly lipoprotein YfiO